MGDGNELGERVAGHEVTVAENGGWRDRIFRLLWVRVGKGNQSKPAFRIKGPEMFLYLMCIFA